MDRVERAIYKALQPTLAAQGFTLNKDWGYFVRKQPYGFDALAVVDQGTAKGPFFEINCYAKVRHDRIEVPWNTLGMVYGEDNQLQTWTLLYRGRADPKLPLLTVNPESMASDAEHAAREIAEFFTHYALPFYQRFSDLREVEEWVNKTVLADLNPSAGGPAEHRAMRALLLAKAVNPARYAIVREAFITHDKGMFPRERRMQMLERVDDMVLAE